MVKKIDVPLTAPEMNHILTLLEDNEREGSYYGNRAHYWSRSQRIKARLWLRLPQPKEPATTNVKEGE